MSRLGGQLKFKGFPLFNYRLQTISYFQHSEIYVDGLIFVIDHFEHFNRSSIDRELDESTR